MLYVFAASDAKTTMMPIMQHSMYAIAHHA